MRRTVKFLAEAEAEYLDAVAWYADKSPTLANRFVMAVRTAVDRIAQSPRQGGAYLGGTRYRALRTFPYLVIYREIDSMVEIVAVSHGRREPGYWLGRLR